MREAFWYGILTGWLTSFIFRMPIWTKLWKRINAKLDEWADV